MKLPRTLAVLLLGVAFILPAAAQPNPAAGPSKWFHHNKKNPNQKKVRHAKPAHRPSKHKSPKH
jgi:hypothetical protein